MNNDFTILIKKIDGFLRKYYKNLILKGLIYSFAIVLLLFLAVDLFEYLAWTGILARTILFYSFLTITVLVFVFYVIIPLFKLIRIGKVLSYKEAAKIIGEHFPDVNDKLINVLQLQELHTQGVGSEQMDLLVASIDQKAARLTPVPFSNAVDMKKNIRHLRYVAPTLLVIIVILIISPAFITEPSKRLVNHTVHYEKPLPYRLNLLNEELTALQYDDFTIRVEASGEEIPSNVFVNDGSYAFRMVETGPGKYEYTINDVNGDVYFQLETEDYKSTKFHLTVFPKPQIFSFDVVLDYPNYLNKKDEVVVNSGDLVVPEGTGLLWKIYTKDTRKVIFRTDDQTHLLESENGNVFEYAEMVKNNFYYTLFAENEHVKGNDSLNFAVQVIKDEYPTIEVEELEEEVVYGFKFFNGMIGDDYGFSSLNFFYRKDSVTELPWIKKEIVIDREIPSQLFNFSLQTQAFALQPGESMSYYFEVRDNDALNGYKAARSATFYLHLPDESEIEEKIDQTSDQIKEELKKAMDELDMVNQQIEEMRLALFEKKELNWHDKQQLGEMLRSQEELRQKIDELIQMNEEINSMEKSSETETDPQLEEKLKQLEEMFDKLNDEEFRKEMKKMQEEMDKMDKDKLDDFLEKMQKNNEQLMNDLDQNLELYKQLEFEKKLEAAVEKLSELAEEQKKLAEETSEKTIDEKKSLEEQEQIKKDFEEIMKDLEKADSLNQELEQPFDVGTDPQEKQDIDNDMNEASSELEKGKPKKASQSQQSAGEKMENMAKSMSMDMQSAMASRMGEDAEQMKKMLDNLLDLSFKQEQLMDEVEQTSQNDPLYVEKADDLKLIQDDFKILHDSLIAISKRQMSVQPFIVKESDKIIMYLDKALGSMQERQKGRALSEQQYAMTSMNNLALMLDESLDQMQAGMPMSGNKPGKACPNPGQGKSMSLEEIQSMQQQMNQGMQKSATEQGMGGKEGVNKNSEQLARMAAMQSEIRKNLQEYMESLEQNQGSGNALSKLIEEMQKTEEDIVNRQITQETLDRQKQIEVRLLKSQQAKQEREQEKKRESKEGKNREMGNQIDILEYKNNKNAQEEVLIAVPIEMSPYYRDLLKKYLYKLESADVKE